MASASPLSQSPRAGSTLAIWLVCIGIGVLFMARGAFLPYSFPLFEHFGNLSYAQIALIISGYTAAQSICAPLAGWYTDRTSVRFALSTSIVCGLASFLVVAAKPGFTASLVAVFVAGLAFILGKIALNTILVVRSSPEVLRRSVAKRATLLNAGSFCGNSIADQVTMHAGYTVHAVLLGLLHLPLAIGLGATTAPPTVPPPPAARRKGAFGLDDVKALCRNRGFLADALRRFALVLPYGCWGTIIPKYVLDVRHSNHAVWLISLTSVCTTLVGAHVLAVHLSALLYRRGFKWEWWSMVSVLLYCAGLLLLMFVSHPGMLPVAIAVFICGEVLMTPCFDETAKRHSTDAAMATCMGLLHLVDSSGRLLGSAFALATYGWMRHSGRHALFWPVVVAVFLVVCSALHAVAHAIGRRVAEPTAPAAFAAAVTIDDPAAADDDAVALRSGSSTPT
jgi:MFS family permease